VKKRVVSGENSTLVGIVTAVVVVATLYFAKVIFIPLALALLFSLLLTPVVSFLERMHFHRLLAIFIVVVALAGLATLAGWKASQQFVDLTSELPTFKTTILEKVRVLRGSSGQSFNQATAAVNDLEKEVATATPGATAADGTKKISPALGSSASRPMTVEVVPPANPLQSVETMLGPVANGSVVLIFTIFILVGREDLRNRLIRLAGGGRLNIITQAMDDAVGRINRYLFLQLLVNSGYGLLIGIALHFIGIPNAALWGCSATILRFLPYVGAPLSALMPILLSLAVFPGWGHALATAGLYLVLEVIVANAVEPFLYGTHIGLSPLAILVAAVFWTLIWGFAGLVLATPLTVCLVVMGRYIPSLKFFNILLGDEPVLPPHAQYYQRLLAADQTEAKHILEQSLHEKSLEDVYTSVLIPALGLAEQDRHRNELDEETQDFIYQSTRDIVEELVELESEHEAKTKAPDDKQPESSATSDKSKMLGIDKLEVLCIPARDEADEVVATLLSQLLERKGYAAQSIPIGSTAEMLSKITERAPSVVCISALPPFALGHARALYARIRAQSPELHIVISLWHYDGDSARAAARLKLADGHRMFTTLSETIQHIAFRAQNRQPDRPLSS
jgi:predicted PurR-regulated permease PerM